MPIALTIVCNLERLAALDVVDRATNSIRLGFGLNLAPGAKGGTLDELRPFVSPWTWRIDGVQISGHRIRRWPVTSSTRVHRH